MPKYILKSGEREQAFQGYKLERRGCCDVMVRDSVMFFNGVVVDTGDLSMQSWVDIGMMEEVKDEDQEIGLLTSGYAIMVDEEDLKKMDVSLIGDIEAESEDISACDIINSNVEEVIARTTVEAIVEGDIVKTDEVLENKELGVESFDIVEKEDVHSMGIPRVRGRKGKGR